MIDIVYGCSGQPGRDNQVEGYCPNVAQVELHSGRWPRPLCVDCADAFDARMVADGMRPGLYTLFTRESGGSVPDLRIVPSTVPAVFPAAGPPVLNKTGGSRVK